MRCSVLGGMRKGVVVVGLVQQAAECGQWSVSWNLQMMRVQRAAKRGAKLGRRSGAALILNLV